MPATEDIIMAGKQGEGPPWKQSRVGRARGSPPPPIAEDQGPGVAPRAQPSWIGRWGGAPIAKAIMIVFGSSGEQVRGGLCKAQGMEDTPHAPTISLVLRRVHVGSTKLMGPGSQKFCRSFWCGPPGRPGQPTRGGYDANGPKTHRQVHAQGPGSQGARTMVMRGGDGGGRGRPRYEPCPQDNFSPLFCAALVGKQVVDFTINGSVWVWRPAHGV